MTESFKNLYEQHRNKINEIRSRCTNCEDGLYGPYLIDPSPVYLRAATKVVFVGQETNSWETSDCDVARQMMCYRKFNLNGRADGSTHPGAFWNVIRKFEQALVGVTHSCTALNLNRYDGGGKRPSWENQTVMSELDFLLLEELRLLKPDITIFFTGPHYDPRIDAILEGGRREVAGFAPRQLCQIESPHILGKVFRTYHPTYLRRRQFETRVIKAICDEARCAA